MIIAGRGFGKTKTGAEDMAAYGLTNPGTLLGIGAPTAADLRKTCFEGESGLLSIIPEVCMLGGSRAKAYNRSLHELYLYNGTIYQGIPAHEPERFRGPQWHRFWGDEFAAWTYLQEAWDLIIPAVRLGDDPKIILTSTPRPVPTLRELLTDSDAIVSYGSTYDNAANLAERALKRLERRYGGTRLGRQELGGELLTDTPGALWKGEWFDREYFRLREKPKDLPRVVIGVDPTNSKDGDEAGIIACGRGNDETGFVLGDYSMQGSPDEWASAAVQAYHDHKADLIVAEVNNGGDMVAFTIKTIDKRVNVKKVHASRGKATRAEPIAAMYAQDRVKHCAFLAKLEDELTTYVPGGTGESPNRMDALVWGMTELFIGDSQIHDVAIRMRGENEDGSTWRGRGR